MPCISVAPPAPPVLPSPFTLGAELPPFSLDPALCCKVLPYPVATPPIPLPPGVLNPTFVSALNAGMAQVLGVLRAVTVRCPRE